jgi:hypothetical protein
MACQIIEGSTIPCRDRVGGISELYLTEFANVTSTTNTSGTITAMTQAASTKFWKYSLEKENAAFTDNYQTSVENGTSWSEPELVFTLKGFTAKNKNNIRLVSQNAVVIIIKDNNGTYKMLGITNGMDLVTAPGVTGKMVNDFNGLTLTFKGKEPNYAPEVSSSVISSMNIGQ